MFFLIPRNSYLQSETQGTAWSQLVQFGPVPAWNLLRLPVGEMITCFFGGFGCLDPTWDDTKNGLRAHRKLGAEKLTFVDIILDISPCNKNCDIAKP